VTLSTLALAVTLMSRPVWNRPGVPTRMTMPRRKFCGHCFRPMSRDARYCPRCGWRPNDGRRDVETRTERQRILARGR